MLLLLNHVSHCFTNLKQFIQKSFSVASVSFLRASMRYALWASQRLFKIIPDNFVW